MQRVATHARRFVLGSQVAHMQQHRTLSATAAAASLGKAAGEEAAAQSPGALSYVMFLPSIVCGYLAYWQYQRSVWKADLIKERQGKLAADEPKDVYSLDELQDYEKVTASGRYVHNRSMFVGPRPRSIPGLGIQSGYFLITPLYDPVRKAAVLVNRGWVPKTWLDDFKTISTAHDAGAAPEPAAGVAAQPAASADAGAAAAPKRKWYQFWGSKSAPAAAAPAPAPAVDAAPAAAAQPVRVVGLVQPSETPSSVLPDNVPDKLEFHWVEVPALARAMGLPSDTPLVQVISTDASTLQQKPKSPIESARNPGSAMGGPVEYPIAKNVQDLVTFATMPRDHINYALIWSSLFVVLGFMARQAIFKPHKSVRMVHASNEQLWNKARSGTQ